MDDSRRRALRAGTTLGTLAGLAAAGVVRVASAQGQGAGAAGQPIAAAAFQTKGVADTLKAMGVPGTAESGDITIVAPDIAENGAVVPVVVRSAIPGTDMIGLMVEKNPNALAGTYELLGTEPEVSMRIKMGQSSDVVALVRAGGKYYVARKEIKVTLGGCGG